MTNIRRLAFRTILTFAFTMVPSLAVHATVIKGTAKDKNGAAIAAPDHLIVTVTYSDNTLENPTPTVTPGVSPNLTSYSFTIVPKSNDNGATYLTATIVYKHGDGTRTVTYMGVPSNLTTALNLDVAFTDAAQTFFITCRGELVTTSAGACCAPSPSSCGETRGRLFFPGKRRCR